jgi:membrane fusion protein (multidrug efflux system)
MKKVFFWLFVIAIIALVGYRGWVAYQRSQIQEVEVKEEIPPVEIRLVKTGPMTETLDLTGDVEGIEEIDVYPKASGKLLGIKVDEGQRVKKDQLLAKIDRDVDGVKFQQAEVTAPAKGIVGKVYLDEGARVSPPDPGPGMGTAILRIVNMDQVKVVVHVIEKDFSRITLNQEARILVEAYPNETFRGKITLISPTINPMTRTASAELTIPNRDHRLKPGMFAQVKIILRETEDAILIPAYAVLEKSESKEVLTVVNGEAHLNTIELGTDFGELVEVKSGLDVGDTLIVAGHHRISDGDQVRILKEGDQ